MSVEPTVELEMFPYRPREFRAWLLEHAEGAAVGESRISTRCPIAKFCGSRGYDHTRALPDLIEVARIKQGAWIVEHVFAPPAWVAAFMRRIDDRSDWSRPISRERALETLDASLRATGTVIVTAAATSSKGVVAADCYTA